MTENTLKNILGISGPVRMASLDCDSIMLEASKFAAQRLSSRLRRSTGEPAIFHALRVARILKYEFSVTEPHILVVGLLHDTIEDSFTTFDELRATFGERVAGDVAILTKNSYRSTICRKKALRLAVSRSSKVVQLVKLADCLDNIRSRANSSRATTTVRNALKLAKILDTPDAAIEVQTALGILKSQLSAIVPYKALI